MTVLAQAAAWSPNPKNPPFFFELPSKDGKIQPDVEARWAANAPLAMIDPYVPNLKKLHAIDIDVGDKDGLAGNNRELSRLLTQDGVANTFELYDGDHTNRIALRVETAVLRRRLNIQIEPTRRRPCGAVAVARGSFEFFGRTVRMRESRSDGP